MKTCKKCLESKSFGDFQKNKNTEDGLQFHCKICRRGPPTLKATCTQSCSRCRVVLTEGNARHRGGKRANEFRCYCRLCDAVVTKNRYLRDGDRIRKAAKDRRLGNPQLQEKQYQNAIRRKYGVSWEDFTDLLIKQVGMCAICGDKMSPPQIDHCHKTGIVRGLLCKRCNHGLGMFKDLPACLRAAAAYLERT